jgi:hypothetical protein
LGNGEAVVFVALAEGKEDLDHPTLFFWLTILLQPATSRPENTMIKRLFSSLSIVILLGSVPSYQVSANNSPNFKAPDWFPSLSYGDNITLTRSDTISMKKGGSYDESNDPALRKGTENWEEPQGSFFIIPAVIVGLIVIVLFFNRK